MIYLWYLQECNTQLKVNQPQIRSPCPQLLPVVYLAHITTSWMSVGRQASTSISHHRLKLYHSLKCLRGTWVTHGLSCPVIRDERVPARILKQALSSPGTHHITALPQQFIDPHPSALVFKAALIHSPRRWNELLWFWRGSRGRAEEVWVVGRGSGDQSLLCCLSENM